MANLYNKDKDEFDHYSGYSNTGVTDDISKGADAEAALGNKQISDAQKNIAFTKDWYADKWKNGGLKGKAGAVMTGLADAASGLRGLNFMTGTAGGETKTGQALQNASEDYRKVGQQASEDAMALQGWANQNEANRHEVESNINQGYKYGKELTPAMEDAIRNFKNAVGNTGLSDQLITSFLTALGFWKPNNEAPQKQSEAPEVINANQNNRTPEIQAQKNAEQDAKDAAAKASAEQSKQNLEKANRTKELQNSLSKVNFAKGKSDVDYYFSKNPAELATYKELNDLDPDFVKKKMGIQYNKFLNLIGE